MDQPTRKLTSGRNRRDLLKAGVLLTGGAMLPTACTVSVSRSIAVNNQVRSRRKLGALEVSNIGLAMQDMSRTYQTAVPNRSEMHRVSWTAYENKDTLFDALGAYGPLEVERILGEAVTASHNKIVIETKFGWNINQKTGQQPEQILPAVVRARSKGNDTLPGTKYRVRVVEFAECGISHRGHRLPSPVCTQ